MLSLGLPRPLRAGLAMALRNAPALYVMLAVLAILPAVLGLATEFVASVLITSALVAHLVSVAAISILNIFQFFALEIATVLFARGVTLQTREAADMVGSRQPAPAAP